MIRLLHNRFSKKRGLVKKNIYVCAYTYAHTYIHICMHTYWVKHMYYEERWMQGMSIESDLCAYRRYLSDGWSQCKHPWEGNLDKDINIIGKWIMQLSGWEHSRQREQDFEVGTCLRCLVTTARSVYLQWNKVSAKFPVTAWGFFALSHFSTIWNCILISLCLFHLTVSSTKTMPVPFSRMYLYQLRGWHMGGECSSLYWRYELLNEGRGEKGWPWARNS